MSPGLNPAQLLYKPVRLNPEGTRPKEPLSSVLLLQLAPQGWEEAAQGTEWH